MRPIFFIHLAIALSLFATNANASSMQALNELGAFPPPPQNIQRISGGNNKAQPNRNPFAIPIPMIPNQAPAPTTSPEPPAMEEFTKEIPESVARTAQPKADKTNVSEAEYLEYIRSNRSNSDSVYFSEYNDVFFNAVALGDIKGLIATKPLILDINMQNNQGYTPLMFAAIYGQVISAEFLLKNKAKVNFKNEQGQTSLHVAAFSGKAELINLLLKNKAKLDAKYSIGYQPIHMAVLSGNVAAISTLVSAGADINAKLDDGTQPIHLAILSENPQLITSLLQMGANINAINNIGQTPLILAAQENKPLSVQTLLQSGANANAIDALGKTAIRVAQENKHNSVLGVIISHQERQRLQQFGIR